MIASIIKTDYRTEYAFACQLYSRVTSCKPRIDRASAGPERNHVSYGHILKGHS